jgi:hypothetical protein
MATPQEYDINDLLKNIKSSDVLASGAKEYDINSLLTELKPYKAESITASANASPTNVLKGAEFFARNPIGSQAINSPFIKDVGKGVASVLDTTIGSAIPSAVGYVTQAVARPFTSPERAAEIAQNVSGAIDKPFGKAFGITEDPAYKQEASQRFTQFISENMDKGADWLSKQTGLPKDDVAYIMNSAAMVGGYQAGKVGIPTSIKNAAEKAITGKEKPTIYQEPTGVLADLNRQFDQAKANLAIEPVQPVTIGGTPGTVPIKPKAVEVLDPATGKAVVAVEQQAPIQERVFNVPLEQPVNIAETAPLSQDILAKREALINKIGIDDIRKSALEGNPKEAASQFITSQADQGPYGSGMTQQINTEKSALDKHFEKVQENAGGKIVRYGTSFQEGDKIQVGKTIKDALQEGFDDHVKETGKLYKEATDLIGDRPVTVNNFNEFLKADENFAYQNEKGLQTGIKQFLNRKGFMDENGNVKPLTVAQAEEVRQYINGKYHHETARLGGQLKGLIDSDVFEQVGGETYQKARKHYQKGIQVYDDPKAVGDLLSDQGVNQKIPDEKVGSKVVTLPNSQFEHLFNTLEADGKTTATNQIKTSLVEQIRQAGQSAKDQPFNSIAAAKEASNLSEKLKIAFKNDPQGLEAIYDGIEVADILHIPTKYPGAGVQTQLLNNKFSEMAVQRAGAIVGGAGGSIFGPVGAGVGAAGGEFLGGKGAAKLRGGRQAAQFEKEIKRKGTPINEVDEFKIKD